MRRLEIHEILAGMYAWADARFISIPSRSRRVGQANRVVPKLLSKDERLGKNPVQVPESPVFGKLAEACAVWTHYLLCRACRPAVFMKL
jgi:hypothetical protein